MTDMIERVAQAIFAKDPESLFTIHQARVYARAAITAMCDPTKDMAENGMVALHDKFQTGFLCCAVYRAMIDAALDETRSTTKGE